jgi:hypothetical protein
VKTGSASAEESLDIMGDLTNRNRTAPGDDGTIVSPSQKHAHRQGGSLASIGENGLTNGLCCLADSHVSASMNLRDGMRDASMNMSDGMRVRFHEQA